MGRSIEVTNSLYLRTLGAPERVQSAIERIQNEGTTVRLLITLCRCEGRVERVGWYQTRMRGRDTRPTYVPNGMFADTMVTNMDRITHRKFESSFQLRYVAGTFARQVGLWMARVVPTFYCCTVLRKIECYVRISTSFVYEYCIAQLRYKICFWTLFLNRRIIFSRASTIPDYWRNTELLFITESRVVVLPLHRSYLHQRGHSMYLSCCDHRQVLRLR